MHVNSKFSLFMDFMFVCLSTHQNVSVTLKSILTVILPLFAEIHRATERQAFWVTDTQVPKWGKQSLTLPSCFRAHTVNKCLRVYVVSLFIFIFFVPFVVDFTVWFHCLKQPTRVVLKQCLVFVYAE